MPIRRALILVCLVVALICLAVGLGLAAQWIGAGLVLAPVVALAFAGKWRAGWLPTASLAGLVCLAAGGLLAGAPALLMILGATAGLAGWDLVTSHHVGDASPTFERKRAVSLGLALGLGLLLVVAGTSVPLQIPFVLLLMLIILDLYGLDRMSRYLRDGP